MLVLHLEKKKIIFISTDFVFGGDDTPKNGYTEKSIPRPVNWYAQTKYEAEKLIQKASVPWIIARIAYPYRANFEKKEYVRIFISLLNYLLTTIMEQIRIFYYFQPQYYNYFFNFNQGHFLIFKYI